MFHPVPRVDRWDPMIIATLFLLFGFGLIASVVWPK